MDTNYNLHYNHSSIFRNDIMPLFTYIKQSSLGYMPVYLYQKHKRPNLCRFINTYKFLLRLYNDLCQSVLDLYRFPAYVRNFWRPFCIVKTLFGGLRYINVSWFMLVVSSRHRRASYCLNSNLVVAFDPSHIIM